jgi:dimethylargininase
MILAITRQVSPSIEKCELTHLEREPIDLEHARSQHAAYESCLAELGCRVCSLPPEQDLPDAVFVEDAAIVLDDLAVITRPGAPSRRPETASIEKALAPYRIIRRIEPPATLDGGDVLRLGTTLYVGVSGRSDAAGIEQLRAHVAPFRYSVAAVPVRGCLHLKSAVTQVGPETVLINRQWVDPAHFSGMQRIDVSPEEPRGANALFIDGQVVYPDDLPRTAQRLHDAGISVRPVGVSELAKAEGGVTCCSLLVRS